MSSQELSPEAEQGFALLVAERQQAVVDEGIGEIDAVGHDAKSRTVWIAVRTLCRQRAPLNLPGDTPHERRNELRDFFTGVLNAPAPTLPSNVALPPETPLPSEADFPSELVTASEVVQLAQRASGGKACGPDGVTMEVLRIPRVAAKIADEMNRVLTGNSASPEWKKAHIVAIPKMPGSMRNEAHRGFWLMSCAAKLFNWMLLN